MTVLYQKGLFQSTEYKDREGFPTAKMLNNQEDTAYPKCFCT